jgi:DNA-binding NarL/FixJ family response regulator
VIRVLIAAPTPALRAGLRALLAAEGLEVVAETASLAGPGGAAQAGGVDVVVVGDPGLLADSGWLAEAEGRLGVVVLADDGRPAAALRALPLAGWALVPGDSGPAELQAAIQVVLQGLAALPRALAAEMLATPRAAMELADPPVEALTAREREVLELLSQGLSNKQIARALTISEHTVKFHVSSLYAKLGATSRADAVSRGARYGLITL